MSPINARNILRHELIGLRARVWRSTNPEAVGLKGTILDETKKTLIIADGSKRKTLPKEITVLRIRLPDARIVEVDGKRLLGRPEERLKIPPRRW